MPSVQKLGTPLACNIAAGGRARGAWAGTWPRGAISTAEGAYVDFQAPAANVPRFKASKGLKDAIN